MPATPHEETTEEKERKFGRFPGMYRVVDLFDDTKDELLEVQLAGMDYYPRETILSAKPLPRGHVHWLILWHLGDKYNVPCYRLLQVNTERYFFTTTDPNHPDTSYETFKAVYTNWGPHTKSVTDAEARYALRLPLARLDLEQRRALEAIAREEEVKEPDGEWNCQSWIKSMLSKAVNAGLFDGGVVDSAIDTLSSEESLNAWLNGQL